MIQGKKIFKNKAVKIWAIVSSILTAVLLVANILLSTVFYVPVCQKFGKERKILDQINQEALVFTPDFETKEAARANGEKVNETINEEGMVLLKNDNNTLPLTNAKKISVFGHNSVDIVTGGTGSAAGINDGHVKGLKESLEGAGFEINPTLWNFYNSGAAGEKRSDAPALSVSGSASALSTGETPYANYTDTVKNSYNDYKDAALIVISRIGGESWDIPRNTMDGKGISEDAHHLQLDINEAELIKNVCAAGFEKVIILLNSSTTFELGFLDDVNNYGYDARIDACIWMGIPGDTGVMALGRILKGEVNPSGHTIDTFSRDFKTDPTWVNFGNDTYTNIPDKKYGNYAYVDYEEGIYLGYRWYETAYAEIKAGNYVPEEYDSIGDLTERADKWYSDHVVYPFGSGTSYTTFTQKITNTSALNAISLDNTKSIKIDVEVENTGDIAGKEVVQVYVSAPYYLNGIEKSAVVLAGFAKTPLINAHSKTTVSVTVDMYNVASYDYNDANGNGFNGYELEHGDYSFYVSKNSHTSIENFQLKLNTDYRYEKDPITDTAVVNRFDDADDNLGSVMSRADFTGTFPEARTDAEKVLSAELNAAINSTANNNPNNYTTRPTYGEDLSTDEQGNVIEFKSLAGIEYDNNEIWDKVLNVVTYNEMVSLVNVGAFMTNRIESIHKEMTTDADGPAGFADFIGNASTSPIYQVNHYCCEPIMAATWNVDLLEDLGEAVGNEALVGDLRNDGGMPYSGWYAPGMNMHRSPFGGRAGEYFSEDSFLTGMMGAYEIKGAMSKGVYTMVKHFACNEQETNRNGVSTWLTEQTLREIYLRPFEMAVKIGGTRGMMSSFNRIGSMWTGGDYRLLTATLREEWGFRGMVICDYNYATPYMDVAQMVYAGGDLNLWGIGSPTWSPKKSSAADMTILRQCTKNILYTTANSNLLNANVIGRKLPYWQIYMLIADAVIAAGLIGWGVAVIVKALKKEEKNHSEQT
jgi:beta-glucosidase